MAFVGGPSQFGGSWDRSLAPAGGVTHGGGPGDIGWGPGVLPPAWAADQGTAGQLASIMAVANNPNLVHGLSPSPIPLWQINGEYPGGPGWVPGVTPLPPGWVDQPGQGGAAPQGPAGAAPNFLGPPVHTNNGAPGFLGPPVHPGQGGHGGPEFLGPPIFENWAKHLHGLLSQYVKHQDASYKTRQQQGAFGGGSALAALLSPMSYGS